MESYPLWIRLHPDATDETLATAVQARLHDPLWLLGRQWQLGELRHDAGATPIDVRVEGVAARIGRMLGGRPAADATGLAIDSRRTPLETVVESKGEGDVEQGNLRLRVEAGLYLVRLLRAAGLHAAAVSWTDRCPFARSSDVAEDEETDAWLDLVEGRVPNPVLLLTAIPEALDPGASTPLPPAEAAVLRNWLEWHGTRFLRASGGPSTWSPSRMEYAFVASAALADGEVLLDAPEYVDGRLDWFDFDEADGALGAADPPSTRISHRIPGPLDFAGMPNPRFWTFEDPSVRFDALDLLSKPDSTPSPAALMVLDFALSYSDDWYLVPLSLDAWSLFEPTTILVTDVFGDTTVARHPEGRWNLYRLESAKAPGGLASFFLAGSPAEAGEGSPIEELHLLRDEVANVAWAVERIVPHPLTRGTESPLPAPATAENSPTGLIWTLAPPSPPRHWFPLLPTEVGRLTLGALWTARDAHPAGELLRELRDVSARHLHQEEVPPEGVQVARQWQSARGSNGSLHFWIGRRKTPRRTEIAPALKFDLVEWK
jgi:hypothetical protein